MSKKPKEKPAPEIVTGLRLLDMAYGGETVARLEEKSEEKSLDPETPTSAQVVFVTGGLPGEVVEAQLYRRKKSFLKANVLQVQETAPERRVAPCPYFGVDKWPNCGGCQWQHADYQAQLSYKANIFRDQLIRLGGYTDREPPLRSPVAAHSEWGYRNNVEFQVDERSGRPCFHRQNSIRLVPIEACYIAHPLITLAIAPLTAALQKHLPSRVHQVTVRVGPVAGDAPVQAEEITALTASSQDSAARLTALERFAGVEPLAGALDQPRPRLLFILRMLGQWELADLQPFLADLQASLDRYVEVSVLGEGRKRRLESLGGPPYLVEVLDGVTYRVPPLAFFQSNSVMATELIAQAMEAFEVAELKLPGAKLLDIFCGVGTFALQMARRGAQVLGIEEYEGAVVAAEENARLNDLANSCRFVAAKAEEYILQLEEEGAHFDGALLDPPRRGCDPALLQSLLKTRPPVLVYVSCDPSTLARDLKILSEGYELIYSRAVDLFPQTYHMESVSVLRRR
jgi:23S rRNA (uracil1939-C5)-methyltransferase